MRTLARSKFGQYSICMALEDGFREYSKEVIRVKRWHKTDKNLRNGFHNPLNRYFEKQTKFFCIYQHSSSKMC